MLLGCVVAAYGAQKFADYPVRAPRDCSASVRGDDVSIGLEPVASVEDQMTYFHTALAPNGFLPVMVVVHNRSKSDSLLLDKGGISYGVGGPGKAAPKEDSVGQKVAITTTSAIPFIGPFIAMGLGKDASEVKQNMVVRELQSQTIAAGDTVHGFLYLPIPKKGARPKIHIQFPIAWAGSDKTSVLTLDF
jgi:hypothetical protein